MEEREDKLWLEKKGLKIVRKTFCFLFVTLIKIQSQFIQYLTALVLLSSP